jgi:hypothetical protein
VGLDIALCGLNNDTSCCVGLTIGGPTAFAGAAPADVAAMTAMPARMGSKGSHELTGSPPARGRFLKFAIVNR